MENGEMKAGKTCSCTHHKVKPWLVILLGLDFFLGAVGVLTMGFVSITWPILLIIWGCTMFCGCCRGGKM